MSLDRFLNERAPVPLAEVLAGIRSASVREAAIAAHLLADKWERIQPAPDGRETRHLMAGFYLRCMSEPVSLSDDDRALEYTLTEFEAARELRSLFEFIFDHPDGPREELPSIVHRVTEMFRQGDACCRNRIETAFLEHILERPELRPYFNFWATDDELREAHRAALQWGLAHPRAR